MENINRIKGESLMNDLKKEMIVKEGISFNYLAKLFKLNGLLPHIMAFRINPIIYLTPEIAGILLENNNINRPINDYNVTKFKNAILRGEWVLNGETIVILKDANIGNGQNRARSVDLADEPIFMEMSCGINPEYFPSFDDNKARTGSDVLHIIGVKYSKTIASALQLFYSYNKQSNEVMSRQVRANSKNNITDSTHITNKMIVELNKKYPKIDECVDNGACHNVAGLGSSIYVFTRYITGEINETTSRTMFHILTTGMPEYDFSEEQNKMVITLRETIRERYNKSKNSIYKDFNTREKTALIFKTWNYVRRGVLVKHIQFNDKKEKYPQPK